MQELLETVVEPSLRYIVDNPDVAAATFTSGSIATGALVGWRGKVKGEREARKLPEKEAWQNYQNLNEYFESESQRRQDLKHLTHIYQSGKRFGYEQVLEDSQAPAPEEEAEYHNQIVRDEDLDSLD